METVRRRELRSLFDMPGQNLQVDTSYVVDRQGNRLGHVEVIQDITALTTQQVAVTTEQMSAQIQELSASAQTLGWVSQELQAHTERFVLNSRPADTDHALRADPRPLRRAA